MNNCSLIRVAVLLSILAFTQANNSLTEEENSFFFESIESVSPREIVGVYYNTVNVSVKEGFDLQTLCLRYLNSSADRNSVTQIIKTATRNSLRSGGIQGSYSNENVLLKSYNPSRGGTIKCEFVYSTTIVNTPLTIASIQSMLNPTPAFSSILTQNTQAAWDLAYPGGGPIGSVTAVASAAALTTSLPTTFSLLCLVAFFNIA